MELFGVRILVDDFGAAQFFYLETLGLDQAWALEDAPVMGVDAGKAQLIVEEPHPDSPDAALVGRRTGISIICENIEQLHQRLSENGVQFLGAPVKQPWGGITADFKDPAGNQFTLMQ